MDRILQVLVKAIDDIEEQLIPILGKNEAGLKAFEAIKNVQSDLIQELQDQIVIEYGQKALDVFLESYAKDLEATNALKLIE